MLKDMAGATEALHAPTHMGKQASPRKCLLMLGLNALAISCFHEVFRQDVERAATNSCLPVHLVSTLHAFTSTCA